jgi:hypothetical protein
MLKRSTCLAVLAGAALLSTSLIAGETTKTDREALVAHLKKTEAAFLKSIDGMSEAQWKWKPAPDRWSVAEAAEHIAKSEDLLRGAAEGTLKAPATPEFLAKTKGKDEMILKVVADRTQKFKAPEPLVPSGSFANEKATIDAFAAARAKTLALAGGTTDLRAYGGKLPVGEVDAYQAILFLSVHTERHTKQIEEVKATAGFPAK